MAIGRGARKNLAARHSSARRSTHGEQILPEVGDPAGGLPGPLSGSGSGVIQRGFDPLNGAVQKARMIVPVARATIVLIEMGSCDRALWTRPKPTTSVTQESASITTLRWVTRLAASSEKLFTTRSPRRPFSPSLGRYYQPMRRGRTPASVPAPQQARPSSLGCRDQSHPHWSSGCNPTKSHVRYTPAGSCRGCGTACPYRQRKGTSLTNPLDCAHRLRHSSEAGRAGASHPRSASIPATL